MADTRTFITGLVSQINTATDPESVTNQMVARVMQYFLDDLASLLQQIDALGGDLDTEEEARRSLADHIGDVQSGLQAQIDALTSGDTSQAIDNFNEIIAFLEGVRQSETLQDLLNNIKLRIDALEGDTSDLSDALDSVEQRITALEKRCGDLEDRYIDLAEYAHQNAELPANGVYLWEGYPVDSRIYSRSDGDTYWLVFCIKKGDTSESRFGIGVSDCLVFSAESRTDTFTFVARYEGNTVPDHVQNAFGYTLASATNDGLMSKEDKEKLDNLTDELMGKFGRKEVAVAWFWGEWPIRRIVPVPEKAGMYMYFTDSHTLKVSEETTPGNFEYVLAILEENVIYIDGIKNIPYIWNGTDMVPIAPENVPASIFNATTEIPVQGYYSLLDPDNQELSAVHAAWNAGKSVSGLILSFELSAGIWKTYQYIGKTVTQTNWLNAENWKDFGSLAAGSEPYIIIDSLIGRPSVGEYYTLETAVQQLLAYQQSSGVTYAKVGLIITYSTGENTMESKQFQGTTVNDFGEVGLWKDFGGGGSRVETKDTPEEGGTDAFSTGGAYEAIPTDISLNTDTPGVVKMQLVNAKGEGVGDEQQFPVGTGSGGGSGTIVTMAFEESPFYANAGGSFILNAAVRSVTTVGSAEQENTIATIDLYDRDTNVLLKTLSFNKSSSASLQTYDFAIDVTEYFTQAGIRRFRCVITDDGGNTGSRNINVTAVDVTVKSSQTLQYTQAGSLTVGGSAKTIPLYKFSNNSSDRGINAITEIYLNGSWQTLGTAVIQDTYSHGITIDPNDCLGETLSHGAYPIRVHGEDVASGVVGNYLYTGIFVIDESSSTPMVVESWYSEDVDATMKLYETIEVNYAVYDPTTNAAEVSVYLDGSSVQTNTAYRSRSYTYSHQITGVASDGTYSAHISMKCGTVYGVTAEFLVSGSVIDAALKAGAIYHFDFSNRNNEETDHSITSGDKTITTTNCNWSTNGFKKFNGTGCLRIAEDMTAELDHYAFQSTDIESNGMAIQFGFAAKNLVDDNAILMKCYNPGVGAGFYITGKAVGIYCSTGLSNHAEERSYKQGELVHVAVVVEPAAEGLGVTRGNTTYYFIKLYLKGEEVAAIGYVAGESNLLQDMPVSWDSTKGDFYLAYIIGWDDYFLFDQAFQNYLTKLTNTDDMVSEYTFEQVMASQQVTENNVTTTVLRPQAAALASRGMPYIIECPYNGSDIEALDHTTSTDETIYVTLYFFDPLHPWRDFVAYDVLRKNQGTTSTKRPLKNPRYYLAAKKGSTYDNTTKTGGTTIVLLHTREEIVAMGYDGELWDIANALAAMNKIQIHDDSIPVDTITVKVDFSDSSNANDCGVCDQMNATYRALGDDYMTPAQRAFDGTWKKGSLTLSGLQMNHSTANIPCAIFRSKSSNGSNPYFHAKGNWKEDKKEQVALGFKDTPGYNKGCLNYGDFIEFYGQEGESLEDEKTRFLATSGLKTDETYILTQYCGTSFKVMKWVDDAWVEQTGSMVQNADGSWSVTGSVMNPVDGFELLNYQGMDWFKGVSSVADMMAPSTAYSKWVQKIINEGDISVESVPAWTYYFESLLDDDDLAIAYALGKKVPYNLYRWMKFCDECDWDTYHETDDDGGAARLLLWKTDMYKYASPHANFAYDGFTDYDAAVDQRAKNMQPMWFLEDGCKIVNGVLYNHLDEPNDTTTGMMAMRMYPNKVYDCDTCNEKDNDGGKTVDAETDPNRLPDENYTNPYAGYKSVLFRNMYLQQTVKINDDGDELSLRTAIAAMRSCTITVNGITLQPFSPAGAKYFFMTARINKWPKNVSSYDGERKYISYSATSDTIYFYALQGLGLTSLPAFIERRWRIRDGFFGTGEFFSGVLSGRVNAPEGAKIYITAAKTGYFGIGNDSSGSVSESVYLQAGESYEFTDFSHEEGALLYIYQADRMSKIDLSEISLSNNFDFSVMTLAEEIHIGCVGKTNLNIGSYTLLTSLNLGELPFLKILNIRGTIITNVVCSSCPRMTTIYAAGSLLERADIADGSKITYMELPTTYKYLKLRYLPNLQISGIVFEDAANTPIEKVVVENCSKIDGLELMQTIITNNSAGLKFVRVSPIDNRGRGEILETISNISGLQGVDATLADGGAPALVGTYRLTKYTEDEYINKWAARFPELTIKQQAYSAFKENDLVTDSENVTNLDNQTGYDYGTTFEPSGHILKIRRKCLPVAGTFDKNQNGMHLDLLSKQNYKKYYDGSDFDNTDQLGRGTDSFIRIPRHWYKGINDFKNQEKYTLVSYNTEAPEDTWTVKKSATLAEAVYRENVGLAMDNVTVGEAFNIDTAVNTLSSCSVYRIDVEDMKQVRYVGMNNATYGAAFVDANGQVISKAALSITGTTNSPVDFSNEQGDYVFRDVPAGAKYLYFTAMRVVPQDIEVFAVDSDDIEAIEPGWELFRSGLEAIYAATIDDLGLLRSIAGRTAKRGNGTSVTSTEWVYDADGTPTAMPVSAMNYTYQDFLNLCAFRGEGYMGTPYEASKQIALISRFMSGNRDDQRVYGFGNSPEYQTGVRDNIGAGSTVYGVHTGVTKVLGMEGFVGCIWEVMDCVGVNISDFKSWRKNKRPAEGAANGKWHIYNPFTQTERVVQGLTSGGGQNIARLKHGRHCDYIPASVSTDTSQYSKSFSAGWWITNSGGRCVGRSGHNASASGGLVCAGASNASSYSSTNSAVRLAFFGRLLNESEIDALDDATNEQLPETGL